ncbi:hypothetical protein H0O02_03235 [Candidatus Micrarchaeota archaeon]|nr:hypothetical protein [Candidatus Micrarchaeota archaeon]
MRIPLIYLKDKQAFVKRGGMLRLLGNPLEIARQFKKDGYILLHISDIDAAKGMETNFDVFDKLTYLINIEVECGEKEHFMERLLAVKARVVVGLPSKLDLGKWKGQKRLLVGMIGKDYAGTAEEVYDIILKEPAAEQVARFSGRRLILYDDCKTKGIKKKAWGVIFSPEP